jgi:chromosome segregation ATPase
MAQAKVTSIDALESFRASMIVFANKAHSVLDQVTDEIGRTRSWIQHDQRLYWEREVRKRSRTLLQAEQELLSARMIKLLDSLAALQAAVHKAKRALEEAEEKLRCVKLWTRDFDSSFEPLAKSLNSLRDYLAQDVPKGIAYLAQAQKALESYGESSSSELLKCPSPEPPTSE